MNLPPFFRSPGRRPLETPPASRHQPVYGARLIINERACKALRDILEQFGQLMEIDVAGEAEYYYNVTHVIVCLDRKKSDMSGAYAEVPVFREDLVPEAPAIFVEPWMFGRIFANDAAKAELEMGVNAHRIVG